MQDFKAQKPKYYLNPNAEFVIENYNSSKPFANFFPGIAGKYGIPMWVFYVNRGQAISSLGTKDKDHAIVEFFPANRAWQLTSLQGFRTFIKILKAQKTLFYEPFHNGIANAEFKLNNRMAITSSDLKLEEINSTLGLKIEVEYFTIPQDAFAGLARIVTIKNISKQTRRIQLLDGLPQIIPFGTANLFLKKLSRTVEAWMNVENIDKGVPFYKLDVDPTDRPEVIHIKEGNFYLSFHYAQGKPKIVKPIVDPETIFGAATDYSCPREFLSVKNFSFPQKEIIRSKTPCGFTLLNLKLKPKEEKSFYSVIGYMRSQKALNESIPRITAPGYLARKKAVNREIIAGLQSDVSTQSGSREFDLYVKQTYLDNILRGGYPVLFTSQSYPCVFYLYSRKHGDLERDYNKFQLQPTYFSQGNGNYRDVSQNRRSDIWFNPQIQEANIINLLNLLQADGFNPLVIKGASFGLKNKEGLRNKLKDVTDEASLSGIMSFLDKPFAPGEIILFLEENHIKLKVSHDEFLNIVISCCTSTPEAEHGEGFWTDHWTYNLDLLESYLGIYPEKLKELLFEKRVFTFFDNSEVVKPRSEKYLLKDGQPRQAHAVYPCNAKREMIKKRGEHPHLVRTDYGKGEIYQTTLINKLLCLLANKLASLDPFGCGIEMEADKPNWYDALNGLPGIFGSSLCETFELKRLVLFIQDALKKAGAEKISITGEVNDFLIALDNIIKEYRKNNSGNKDYIYWDKSCCLKEDYRQKTRFGLSGKESEIQAGALLPILANALKKVEQGIAKAKDKKDDIYYSYFINEVARYEPIRDQLIKPTRFNQKRLPLFLAGQVHALRLSKDVNEARRIYKATRESDLYDRKLKMYKITASLKSMPEEIGRCRVFPPGWLEHESIWLHMEYKYLLEMLKHGLYEEFFADFKNCLIPFQPAERYGRNITENSSFLVSSAFPDKRLHGNGFVARLSGSTAEFLQMWLMMNVGIAPFFMNGKGELNLRLGPVLCSWLFDRQGIYRFKFLSRINVTYHNPKKKNTFGHSSVKIEKIIFNDKDGRPIEIKSDIIPGPYAQQVRSCQITRLDVYFE